MFKGEREELTLQFQCTQSVVDAVEQAQNFNLGVKDRLKLRQRQTGDTAVVQSKKQGSYICMVDEFG